LKDRRGVDFLLLCRLRDGPRNTPPHRWSATRRPTAVVLRRMPMGPARTLIVDRYGELPGGCSYARFRGWTQPERNRVLPGGDLPAPRRRSPQRRARCAPGTVAAAKTCTCWRARCRNRVGHPHERFTCAPTCWVAGRRTGIFLDQRENYFRAAAATLGQRRPRQALDCFTCTSGLALCTWPAKCESVEA